MTDQHERSQEALPKELQAAIVGWTEARKDLTPREQVVIALRAGLQLIPHGIGSALDAGYFGTLEARRLKRIEETVRFLVDRVSLLGEEYASAVKPDYFETEEFAVLFEDCWHKILAESQQEKLQALRRALVSVIVCKPTYPFAKRKFFIGSFDRIAAYHLEILQVLRSRYRSKKDTFQIKELWAILEAEAQADRDYVYAAVDVLANLRYIEHRTVPQVENGRIDYPRQQFRLTALGAEFLEFIRSSDGGA